MTYGEIVLQQIKATSDPSQYYSWGARNFVQNEDEQWMSFEVSGLKFQGIVKISLINDTYTVEFLKPVEGVVKVYEKESGIYWPELFSTIDDYIEKVPQYAF